jgi:predicted ArsR family transcriptional regulator
LRAHNLQMVLDLLARSPEPISRADVAAQAGVTRATATSLVDALVAAGLAEELPPVFSGRAGRPAIPVRIARGTLAGVGAEIGVD